MIKNSAVRGALCAGMLALALAAPLCSAQTDASQPTSPDISKRVEDLEKELADLKAQLAAQKAAEPAAAPATPPASAAVATTTPAPTPAPTGLAGLLGPTTISGFVDTYYGYNSNQPSTRTNAFRNFDINSAQFGLNMIELVADKAPDATASRVGYHIAVGFGQAINQVNATEPGPGYPATTTTTNFDQYLKEGYLEYLAPVGKGLQLNVGKFVTPAGAEVIESKDNWNYTRGILFAWAIPYFHFGMSGKYTFNSKFALTGYLVNGWNNSVDNNSGKTTGFSAAWTPNSKFTLIQNYLVGPEQTDINGNFRHLYDAVLIYNPNAKLSLMANYDYGHDRPFGGPSSVHWSGIAGYIKYAMNDKWSVAGRGEYFNDHDGFETGTTQNLSEFTFTLQRMLASKIISRLEFRRDMSSADTFPYRSGPPAYGPTDAQNTVTVGLIYAFSSADAK